MEGITSFDPPAPILSRRSLLSSLPLAARFPRRRPLALVPFVSTDDQLGRLALHYAAASDHLASLVEEENALPVSEYWDFEERFIAPAEATFDRTERALLAAMQERGIVVMVVAGRLFIDDQADPVRLPDRPQLVRVFPAKGGAR